MATSIKGRVITPEMNDLLKRSGDPNPAIGGPARFELIKALELPLRRGVLDGDNLAGIYEVDNLEPGVAAEYPLDFYSSTALKDEYVAVTMPQLGGLANKTIQGDYLMVPTYSIGASIDWALKYARHARWNIVARAMQVMEGMVTLKKNRDGWHTILAGAAARNQVVYDNAATAGLFTKRLVELARLQMIRNGGGNATSSGKGQLTDIFMSPESLGDIRSWDLTQVPDNIRSQIFVGGGDQSLTSIFGVRLHGLAEFGDGQEYDLYWANTLAASLATDKVELAIGLDLVNRDCFIHPIDEPWSMWEDPTLHKSQRAGVYGWFRGGWAICDNRRTLALGI